MNHYEDEDDLWMKMQDEARCNVEEEPILSISSLPSGTLYDLFQGMPTSFENVGWLTDGSQNHSQIFDASAPLDTLRDKFKC